MRHLGLVKRQPKFSTSQQQPEQTKKKRCDAMTFLKITLEYTIFFAIIVGKQGGLLFDLKINNTVWNLKLKQNNLTEKKRTSMHYYNYLSVHFSLYAFHTATTTTRIKSMNTTTTNWTFEEEEFHVEFPFLNWLQWTNKQQKQTFSASSIHYSIILQYVVCSFFYAVLATFHQQNRFWI